MELGCGFVLTYSTKWLFATCHPETEGIRFQNGAAMTLMSLTSDRIIKKWKGRTSSHNDLMDKYSTQEPMAGGIQSGK